MKQISVPFISCLKVKFYSKEKHREASPPCKGAGLSEKSDLLPTRHHFSPGSDHVSFHTTVNSVLVSPFLMDCELLEVRDCVLL